MVPHGGYTVTNSPTRYAYPAPSHDIRSSRGAIFALKMANLGRLRNLLCLHFWFKQTSGREGPGRMLTWKCRGWLTAACLGEHCPRAHAQFRVVRALFCTIAHC